VNSGGGIKVQLFGVPCIYRGGQKSVFRRKKTLLLFTYLLVEVKTHSRSQLASLLWPDLQQSLSLKYLRHSLYEIRKLLPELELESNRQFVSVVRAPKLSVDLWMLEEELSRSGSERNLQTMDQDLIDSLGRELLEGVWLDEELDLYANWLYSVRESFRRKASQLFARVCRGFAGPDEREEQLTILNKWKSIDEYEEGVYDQIVRLYLNGGERTSAVREYRSYANKVRDELGLEMGEILSQRLKTLLEAEDSESFPPMEGSALSGNLPNLKYMDCGDEYICYQRFGEGAIPLLIVPGFMSHLEINWDNTELRRFFETLAMSFDVVMFDRRGMGASDRMSSAATSEQVVEDIVALLDHIGVHKINVFGISEGGSPSIEFAAKHPDRVNRLILYGTAPKFLRCDNWQWGLTEEQFEKWKGQMIAAWGDGSTIAKFAPSKKKNIDQVSWWGKCMRMSSSPSEVEKVIETMKCLDVRASLAAVTAPTLICHKQGDQVVRSDVARSLQQKIPNARLSLLAGSDHWFWTEDACVLLDEIAAFLLEPTVE
jgi:pimeloyl-ACP methyl ester carboxylesterase/DNA-binding SARP family transcriptional activator